MAEHTGESDRSPTEKDPTGTRNLEWEVGGQRRGRTPVPSVKWEGPGSQDSWGASRAPRGA